MNDAAWKRFRQEQSYLTKTLRNYISTTEYGRNKMDIAATEITINGVVYVRADSIEESKPHGKRHVVVIDRGWIIAGDLTEQDGRIYLSRAVQVVRWFDNIGFNGMLENPKGGKVTLAVMKHIFDLPCEAELFRIPVNQDWGL